MLIIRTQDGRSILNAAHVEDFRLCKSGEAATIQAVTNAETNSRSTIYTGTIDECRIAYILLYDKLAADISVDLFDFSVDPQGELPAVKEGR